jgi:hypothetical protein
MTEVDALKRALYFYQNGHREILIVEMKASDLISIRQVYTDFATSAV